MDTATAPYTISMATGEIIILLLLTFFMGILLCWLLRQMGWCCRTRKVTTANKFRHLNLDLPQPIIPEVYVPKVKVQHRLDAPNNPNNHLNIDTPEVTMPDASTLPPLDLLLANIDPHKPIIDPPEGDTQQMLEAPLLSMENPPVESPYISPSNSIELPTIDPLLAAIDPHKPIVDPHDSELDTELETEMEIPTMPIDIDPHKPIIDPPDMELQPSASASSNLFNDWLHKAKDSVEHLTEKATPTTHEWLNKAKDSVGHLTEKVTPTANEWMHKAKDSVEHLTEKATPATHEWLNKAKEIGNGITAKGNSLSSSDTLSKGGATLAALATSAKELTEKLASNLSSKQDDLQKLVGIGPTFAAILHRAGINTYTQLAETSPQKLQALLIVEDEQFSKHDTSSWPRQAAMAAYEEWEQLKAYQDSL
ncbi:hypothetical protein [Thiothrix lacustris]|uniref:hypothetical protein n=1 Tax=Thiothrix lacustris TaxID=525917 RepID=UPI000491D8A5|nr:hypothetical protein [Thiothrix lacustris]